MHCGHLCDKIRKNGQINTAQDRLSGLFAAVVPPECHMWGYNPQDFSTRFARSNICTPHFENFGAASGTRDQIQPILTTINSNYTKIA